VLRLKVLNLLLALLPVHPAFLGVWGKSERLNKHCASKSESLKDWITTVTAAIERK
jgi:hypothetical protein